MTGSSVRGSSCFGCSLYHCSSCSPPEEVHGSRREQGIQLDCVVLAPRETPQPISAAKNLMLCLFPVVVVVGAEGER